MPILWFEQHVKMSADIADEVKMILTLPYSGQLMGILFIVFGIVQILFLPIKKFLSHRFCLTQSKDSDFDKNDKAIDLSSPEIYPLITEKPKDGFSLIRSNHTNNVVT